MSASTSVSPSSVPIVTDIVTKTLSDLRTDLDNLIKHNITICDLRNNLHKIFDKTSGLTEEEQCRVDGLENRLKTEEETQRDKIEQFSDRACGLHEQVRQRRQTAMEIQKRNEMMAELLGESSTPLAGKRKNDAIYDEKENTSHTPEQQKVLAQLMEMGFEFEMCSEVVKKRSTVNDCIAFIHEKILNVLRKKWVSFSIAIASIIRIWCFLGNILLKDLHGITVQISFEACNFPIIYLDGVKITEVKARFAIGETTV